MSAISASEGVGGQVPFVSVVVPAYNAMKTIAVCLESLLAQDYPVDRREIIVVDNNSSDETAAIVARYPVRLLHEHSRQSSYAARNTGWRQARGELVAFTDADCVADPEWLARLAEGFTDAAIGGVAGRVLALSPATVLERFAEQRRQVSNDASMNCSYLPYAITANVAYRREALEALGGFDESLISGGDADFAWRLQQQLGRRLVFALEALVRHKHRDTFGSFWRQHRLYGYGTAMLYERYPGYRKSLGEEARYAAARVFRFFARGLSRVVRWPWRRREPAVYFAEHFLEVACTTARFLGLISYRGSVSDTGTTPGIRYGLSTVSPPYLIPAGAPVVSVIIPAYNRAELLGPTLESVLAQTYADYEVIVVDDGSQDATGPAVQAYVPRFGGRLFYVYQRNQGLPGARNTGCRLARGRYLAFLDSDDLWKPEKLATQVPLLEADPRLGLIASMAEVINDAGQVVRVKPEAPPGDTLAEMVERGTAPPSSFVARREAMAQVGWFDPAIRPGLEDLDLGFRLAAAGWTIRTLPQPLIRYRWHGANMSADTVGMYQGYVLTYEKLLASRPAGVPHRQVRRLVGKYRYLLGTAHWRRQQARAGLPHVLRAVQVAPLIGLAFANGAPWWRRLGSAVKPYVVILGMTAALTHPDRETT